MKKGQVRFCIVATLRPVEIKPRSGCVAREAGKQISNEPDDKPDHDEDDDEDDGLIKLPWRQWC